MLTPVLTTKMLLAVLRQFNSIYINHKSRFYTAKSFGIQVIAIYVYICFIGRRYIGFLSRHI